MTDSLTAPDLIEMFRAISARMTCDRDYLSHLDGQIGDADHGTSMAQGFAVVVRALHDSDLKESSMADVFSFAARSFLNEVGASTGPLYASALTAAAAEAGNRHAIAPADALRLIGAMSDGIARRGKASVGDKTMLDALAPAAHAIRTALDAGRAPGEALDRAVAGAGREATRAMIASRGRASRLGERSLGHVDPGAASAAAIMEAIPTAFRAMRAFGPPLDDA